MDKIEIWKDILGYEGLYQVSDLGRVRSLDRIVPRKKGNFPKKGCIFKTVLNGNGYPQVILSKNGKLTNCRVHSLVVWVFLGWKANKTCKNGVINHIDFNKTNNKLSNLEVISKRENSINYKDVVGGYFCKSRKKWICQLRLTPKIRTIGKFDKKEECTSFYNKAVLHKKLYNGNLKEFTNKITNL